MGERIDARQLLAGAVEGDWRTVFTEIDLLAREGDWGALTEVRTRALELRGAPLASVRERIENRAAADPSGASALARWLAPESPAPRRAGELADRLAQSLTWTAIAALGFRDGILWQAAHARVLRRDDLSRDPTARRLAAAAAAAGDPLAALPLTPDPIESGALLPVLTPDGMTWTLPFGPHLEGLSPVVPTHSWLTPRRMRQEALPAFGHWGHVGAAIGLPAGAATPGSAAGAFAALLPEICQEAGAMRVLEVSRSDAWAFLLCAAFAGDIAPRRNSADARLAAWRTLAGLADMPDAPTASVAAFATGARWYVLDVASAWFTRRARDAAIVVNCRTHWAAAAATEA